MGLGRGSKDGEKNQAARRRLNIILTQKAILMLILVFASTACNVTGVDGRCIDDRTGEPLKQVRDVDGQLWSVEKAVEELGTLTLEYCGVSINVPLGGGGHLQYRWGSLPSGD